MISILVPTLNEAKNIPKLIKKLNNFQYKYELIIVDDNSTDNTEQIVRKFLNKKIKFLKRVEINRDLSQSIMLGAENAKYKHVLVLDCDLQHDITDANLMFKKLLKYNLDIVIGSRFLTQKYSGNLGFFRSLFSLSFIFTINFLLKKKTTDPLSGFFICKKNIMFKNKDNYFLKGYKILFDIIYNSRQNVKIKDIQINFGKRKHGKSKLNSRIVRIFIEQIFYTLKKNFLLNKKKKII